MANRDFRNLGRRRTMDLSALNDDAQQTPPRRPQRNWSLIWGIVSIFLVICLVVGAGGYYYFDRSQNPAAPTEQAQTDTGQPQVQPGQPGQTINTAVPGAPREKITACIVNFGPYFATVLIPNNNPVYELEVIPLNFYETVDQLDAGQFMNEAGEADQIRMLTDSTCDVLLTTLDVIAKHPQMGKLIALVGQSDGADKTYAWNVGVTPQCAGKPINIFNDAKGCVFAVAEDSVGYYQTLSFLKLAGISASEVTIHTYPTPDDAVAACLNHEADVCSGWVPTIDDLDPIATNGQTKLMVSTKFLKTIYDGVFVSNNANQNKSSAVLAFTEDWFKAVKMMQDDFPGAAAKIASWQYNGMPTNEYTFVYPGSETEDLKLWFDGVYAQASFNSHFVFPANPDILYDILKTNREGWEWGQLPLDGGFDPANMVNLSYFTTLSGRNDLVSQNPFVDNSFSPFPSQSNQPATREQLIALPTLVEVTCPNVYFRPGQTTLDPDQRAALVDCGLKIKPLMNQSDIQFLIVGSAAWPDPATFGIRYQQCGTFTEDDYCAGVAKDRASYVLSVFTGDPQLLLPGNRFAIDYRLGEMTSDQQVLQENRFGAIEAKIGGLE